MLNWNQWMGGGMPVHPNIVVEVRFRYAGSGTGPASQFRWSHDLYNAYGADDVVAFRVIAEEQVSQHEIKKESSGN